MSRMLKLKWLFCFRFLAENKNKKQAAENENGRDKEQSVSDREKDKGSKSGDLFNISSASFSDSKEDKAVPFFDAGEEEFLKSHGLKERDLEEDGEVKPTLNPREIFGKWGDEPTYPTAYPSFKEKNRRDMEEEDNMEEELYRSRKHGTKKEEKAKKKEKKEKEKSRRSPSPPATSREKERPLFPVIPRDESPVRHLSSSREEFELKISSLDDMPWYVQPSSCMSRTLQKYDLAWFLLLHVLMSSVLSALPCHVTCSLRKIRSFGPFSSTFSRHSFARPPLSCSLST